MGKTGFGMSMAGRFFFLVMSCTLIWNCGQSEADEAEAYQALLESVKIAQSEGDRVVAISALREALAIRPEDHAMRQQLAVSLGEALQADLGMAVLDEGTLPLDSSQQRNHFRLIAELAEQCDQFQRATQAYATLIDKGWATWETHSRLGDLRRRLGEFSGAVSHYERALAANPGHGPSRVAKVLCLIRVGEDLAARDALIEDLKRFPEHPGITQIACRLLVTSQNPGVANVPVAQALAKQVEGIALTSDWAETLALVAAGSGDFEKAISWLQQALRMMRSIEQFDSSNALIAQMQAFVRREHPTQAYRPVDPIYFARNYDHWFDRKTQVVQDRSVQEILHQIVKLADPSSNSFLNEQRANQLRAQIKTRDEEGLLALLPTAALEMLRAGKTKESLAALHKLEALLSDQGIVTDGEQKRWLLDQFGVAQLRLAEQENCLDNHHAQACILPIVGNGVHKLETGSQGAISYFEQILEVMPENARAKWLLNVAYMTLGQYPQKVPLAWRAPLDTGGAIPAMAPFKNIAFNWDVAVNGLSGGAIVEDFDGDGLLDLMVSSWGLRDQLRFFHNSGKGFLDRTQAAGLIGQWSGLNMMQTDFNNDGFADVFILRGAWLGASGQHPNSLLRNNGDGTFTDVTQQAGLLSFKPTQTAVWQDFDGDGWLDVFIGNESSGADRFSSELFRNLGNGHFEEVAAECGLAIEAFVKGVAAGDVDGDGRIDLFLSIYGGENRLFLNQAPSSSRPWQFVDATEKAGLGKPIDSFPTWFWDFDNDGWLDLFVSDYSARQLEPVYRDLMGESHGSETSRLFRNRGDGTFEDVSKVMGLDQLLVGMGANFGDLDNDGFLDFYVGNGTPDLGVLIPNRIFKNRKGVAFVDITLGTGMAHLQKGHGVAFADMDNDGDQDVYITLGGAYQGDVYPNALFQNSMVNQFSWLKLDLRGTKANRRAIGARIEIRGQTPQGPWQIHRVVGSGGSFGASPLRQEIGLGPIVGEVTINVIWPGSGQRDTFTKVAPNRFYRIVEGRKELEVLVLPTFSAPAKVNHH